MPYQVSQFDIADDFDWQSIVETYDDDGNLILREKVYDSGFRANAEYTNGVLTTLTQIDEIGGAPGVGAGWSTIVTQYDANGSLLSRVTENDDGTQRTDSFVNGVLVRTVDTDNSAGGTAAGWRSVTTVYDTSGTVQSQAALLDDGVAVLTTYVAGVKYAKSEFDLTGTRDWTAIQTTYDATGAPDLRLTDYDNGTRRQDDWVDGTISTVAFYDLSTDGSAENWQSVVSSYDAAGALASKIAAFDNGLIREETFTAGQRATFVETDTGDATGNGVKNFHSVSITYDAAGKVAQKVTVLDNGVIKSEEFDAGKRTTASQLDGDDVANWDEIIFEYDENGRVALRADTFDNDDQTIQVYDDGARDLRIEFDGDGDRPWEVRVTDYTPDGGGAPTAVAYNSLSDAPVAIQDYFDFIA